MRIALIVFSLLSSVAASAAAPKPTESAPEVSFDFALYFAPDPTSDPVEALDGLRASKYSRLEAVGMLSHRWVELENYLPPPAEYFPFVTIDLKPEIAARFSGASYVLVMTFRSPPENCLELNRLACGITADLAEATGGYPWDEECRQLYSPQAWRARRVDTWRQGLPDITEHINMHAYRNPQLIRIITLGLKKFNLPDFTLYDVNSSASLSAGNTINYLAQAMVEGQQPENAKLNLALNSLLHPTVRSEALENPLDGATGEIEIVLQEAEWEEGDPLNRIFNLTFPHIEAETATERQGIAFSRLYGSRDEAQGIKGDDPELLEASERAKKAFYPLKDRFDAGLEANERLVVKYGFPVAGEKEFMWVEVLQWSDETIDGILLNDSLYDEQLIQGKRVTVPVSEVFDYIHYLPDGTSVGNETGKVLMSRQ